MLKIINATKIFNKGTVNERVALNDVSLNLDKGDFVTIIGGNGAGKSTLLNIISGNYLIDKGRILLDNEDITFKPEYKRAYNIGRLFQDPLKGTAPNMTVEENLVLALGRGKKRGLRFGISNKERELFKERLAELNLGLEDRLKSKVGLLSGGQRQAITLIMATLNTPKLLMLDEHTAALDPSTAEKVLSLTKKIVAKDNITTLMITHNIQSALECGNRTIMLEQGKIILDIKGEERDKLTVSKVLELFKQKSNKELDNDRMLLE